MNLFDTTAHAPRQTLRSGTRVWLRIGTSEQGQTLLKAGRVIRARGDQVRVDMPGFGIHDFDRRDVRRA